MANIPQKQQQAMLAAQKKDVACAGGMVGKGGENVFEQKNLSRPDEVRNFTKGKVDIVRLGDLTFGRFTMQPGWKWSEHVKPIVKTDWCTHTHHIFIESGRMHLRMSDGKEYEGGPGDLLICPANHDAWTVGDEP
jgi:quercetin dioxygenase-like cupin family protein